MALLGFGNSPSNERLALPSQLPQVSTMTSISQTQKARNVAPSSLDADIKVLDRAKSTCGIPPAQIAFDSASALLTTIRV